MLHGEHGLLKYIEGVLQARGHAVICIAEGAGQARRPRLRPHHAPSLCLRRRCSFYPKFVVTWVYHAAVEAAYKWSCSDNRCITSKV